MLMLVSLQDALCPGVAMTASFSELESYQLYTSSYREQSLDQGVTICPTVRAAHSAQLVPREFQCIPSCQTKIIIASRGQKGLPTSFMT